MVADIYSSIHLRSTEILLRAGHKAGSYFFAIF
jgi:hypothetical protein